MQHRSPLASRAVMHSDPRSTDRSQASSCIANRVQKRASGTALSGFNCRSRRPENAFAHSQTRQRQGKKHDHTTRISLRNSEPGKRSNQRHTKQRDTSITSANSEAATLNSYPTWDRSRRGRECFLHKVIRVRLLKSFCSCQSRFLVLSAPSQGFGRAFRGKAD